MREDRPKWQKIAVFLVILLGMPSPIHAILLSRMASEGFPAIWIEVIFYAAFVVAAFTFAFLMVFNRLWFMRSASTANGGPGSK
ncbi:MAG TPA: hypothetical protein VEM77_06420 [Thermoplasmata archaeon]|nr:hypothetical protein [Thermoplasmata archaeon]HYV09121.1 hypothetical protein [Thermoplasmata archaeon]